MGVSTVVGLGLELGQNWKKCLVHGRELGTVQALAFNLFEERTCSSRSPVMSVFTTKIEWQQPPPLPTPKTYQ